MTYEEFTQQYQQKVNEIWSHMTIDEYGGVYMNVQNQKIKYENLKYLKKDGKSFIYDSSTQKLYDQMFNYYQDGNFYNPFGQLVQESEELRNAIDVSYREVVDEPPVSQSKKQKYKPVKGPKLKPKTNLDDMIKEYRQILFDKYKKFANESQIGAAIFGDDNLLNKNFFDIVNNNGGIYSETVRYDMRIGISDREKELLEYFKKQGLTQHIETIENASGRTYDVVVDDKEKFINETVIDEDFRKRLNEYTSSEEFDNLYKNNIKIEEATEEITEEVAKNTTEETGKQAEHNFKETLEQSAKEMAEESSKKVSKNTAKALPKKSLGGGGKAAIAIAGLIIGGMVLSSDDEPKKKSEKSKAHSLPKSTNTEEFDNSYAMQMAQDISSYRYGKHMTGFVNY